MNMLICICILTFGGMLLFLVRKKRGFNNFKKERKTFTKEERYQRYKESLSNRQPPKSYEEQLDELGYTFDMINTIRAEATAKNYRDGVYHTNPKAEYGSPDNPEVVGMPDCSNSLQFSIERKHWVLTDGLGNGWIR